jgi:hypothetical protein
MTENNPVILPNICNVSIKNDYISLDKEKEIKLANEKLKLLNENRKLIDRINELKSNIIHLQEIDESEESDSDDFDDSNKELNESEEKELIPEKYNLDPSKDDNLILIDRIEELKINIIKLQDKLGVQICEFFDSCKGIEETADMFCYDNLEDCYWGLNEYLGCFDPIYSAHDYEYCSKEIFGEESDEEEEIKDIPELLILKTTDNIKNNTISNYVIENLNKNNIESLFETFDEAYDNYINKTNEFNLLNDTNLKISTENICKLQDLFGW